MNNKDFNNILNATIESIKDNKNVFLSLNKEDNEVAYFHFDVNKLIEILKKYKNKCIAKKGKKTLLISHYGNPYITAMLCVESLMNNSEIIIGIENLCYGVNKGIVRVFNNVLKEYKIDRQIDLKNNLLNQEIEKMSIDKIICLGIFNTYEDYKNISKFEIEFIPLYNLFLYYDSEEYDELVEKIRIYSIDNFFEVEILDYEEDFEEVLYIKNFEKRYFSVLLSKDIEKQHLFKENDKSKILCINENPFKNFEWKLPENIF